MTTKFLFTKIGGILRTSDLFERSTKKIRGTWQLFEYFVDKEEQLVHLQCDELKAKNESMQIEFGEKDFVQKSSVPINFIENLTNGKWEMNRNYLQLIDEKEFRNSVKYQFAFEKDNLKLLKKNVQGEIEFFGFFKRLSS